MEPYLERNVYSCERQETHNFFLNLFELCHNSHICLSIWKRILKVSIVTVCHKDKHHLVLCSSDHLIKVKIITLSNFYSLILHQFYDKLRLLCIEKLSYKLTKIVCVRSGHNSVWIRKFVSCHWLHTHFFFNCAIPADLKTFPSASHVSMLTSSCLHYLVALFSYFVSNAGRLHCWGLNCVDTC